MAGDEGFEPPNAGTRNQCLTTWRIPNGSVCWRTGAQRSLFYHIRPGCRCLCYNYGMNRRGGFTLVELVVVIITVLLLAGLAVIGVSRYSADTRDAQRNQSATSISNALEAYFTKNGNYPSCKAVTANANTLLSGVFANSGLTKEDLLVPGSVKTETNALRCGETLALVGDDFIEYKGDGSTSCLGSGSCSKYTLVYRKELSSTTNEIASHGLYAGPAVGQTVTDLPTKDNVTTLGAPTLSVIVNSPTQVTSNWIPGTNATDETIYTVQRATNSTFTAGLVTVSGVEGTNSVASGLANGRTYYFRVQAVSGELKSAYSNIASNIITPATPVDVKASATSASQVNVSWGTAFNATGYTVNYGLSEDTLTNVAISKTTSTVISANITPGTEWFFKVFATNNGAESIASSTVKVTTPISAPAQFALTSTNDGTSLTGIAKAATCPTGTTKYYAWKANDTAWVQGTNYNQVVYPLSIGQKVILTAAVRCQKGSALSAYTIATNSVTYERPGMNLKLTAGEDSCAAGYCGRTVNATWANICQTTSANIKAKQLGSKSAWKTNNANSDSIKWKGAKSPGVKVNYYEVNIGCASASASINVMSAYKCTGCM
jgi:type II secretory pathway pseudopilin PulG